jgi:superfamily II DNA or RNA helicase
VTDESLAALGQRARQESLAGLAAPLSSLIESPFCSSRDRAVLAHVKRHLDLQSVDDACAPAVDDFILRDYGESRLTDIVHAVSLWLTEFELDNGDFEDTAFTQQDRDDGDDSEMDPWTPQLEAPGSDGRSAPPSDLIALRAWAEERGLLGWLGDPAPHSPYANSFPGKSLPAATIEEALTAASPAPAPRTGTRRSAPYDPTEILIRMRRESARAVLARAADNIAYMSAQRRDRAAKARPIDPAMTKLAEAVSAARTRLLDLPALQPTPQPRDGEFIPAPLVFQDSPPRLLYDQASSRHDSLLTGYRTPSLVTITLAGWDTGALTVSCVCSRSKTGCPHPLGALDAFVELLTQPTARAYDPLYEFVTVPPWTRFLHRLDQVLVGLPPTGAPKERLSWRIGRDHSGDVALEPQVHKRGASGSWSRGTRIALPKLLRRSDLGATAADVRTTELLLGGAEYAGYYSGAPSPSRIFRAIEALSGASNVFLTERRDAPVVIRKVDPRLQLQRPADAGSNDNAQAVELRITVDDLALTPREVLDRTTDCYFIDLDASANLCRLAVLGRDLEAMLRAAAVEPVVFPDTVLGEVIPRLERFETTVGLDLPGDLRGEMILPDERLVCRLTPIGDSGLRIEVRVRPLVGAGEWPPGQGPRVLMTSGAKGRVHTERRFAEEVASADRLLAALGLAGARSSGAQTFDVDVVEADQALAAFTALRERGDDVIVEWPAETWKIGSAKRGGLRLQVTERRDWFGLQGGVEVDGQMIPIAVLLAAVRGGDRYIMLGARRFALIEDELRQRLMGLKDVVFEGRGGIELGAPAADALADLVEDERQLESIPSFTEMRARLLRAAHVEPKIPAKLRATLRPYQVEGFRWLARLAEAGAGACLADDMGLGKTVQVLAVLLARAKKGPALVVAPTSVVANWISEAEKFVPSLRCVLYRGPGRTDALANVSAGDLVVTSYALAVLDAEALAAVPFAALVLDEAQALKNAATRRSRAIRTLKADWRIALSGTPIENHLGELWSLYRVVSPALFGSWEQFRERFAMPIERQSNPERRETLAKLLRPFLLRRTKEVVAPELPAKTEVERLIELSRAERKLYEATRMAALADLDEKSGQGEKNGKGGESTTPGNVARARIQILAALTRLRQLACHPKLGNGDSHVPSSKLAALIEILREVRDAGHRALVFSQFTRFLDLARAALEAEGLRVLSLDGGTRPEDRTTRVAAFQRGEADAFLISLRAGGTGLNLTAADYVIHLDPWWNPAVEDQATDRAHRIGQTKTITVIRLVARGTVEETVMSLHADKRGLAASVLDGTDAAARLDTKDLIALLRQTASPGDLEDLDDESTPTAEDEVLEDSGQDPSRDPSQDPSQDPSRDPSQDPLEPAPSSRPAPQIRR